MTIFVAVSHWLQHYIVAAMTLIFVLIFASLYWPGRREDVERPGLIPFKDDN